MIWCESAKQGEKYGWIFFLAEFDDLYRLLGGDGASHTTVKKYFLETPDPVAELFDRFNPFIPVHLFYGCAYAFFRSGDSAECGSGRVFFQWSLQRGAESEKRETIRRRMKLFNAAHEKTGTAP